MSDQQGSPFSRDIVGLASILLGGILELAPLFLLNSTPAPLSTVALTAPNGQPFSIAAALGLVLIIAGAFYLVRRR